VTEVDWAAGRSVVLTPGRYRRTATHVRRTGS
jgi:hypothetical protein